MGWQVLTPTNASFSGSGVVNGQILDGERFLVTGLVFSLSVQHVPEGAQDPLLVVSLSTGPDDGYGGLRLSRRSRTPAGMSTTASAGVGFYEPLPVFGLAVGEQVRARAFSGDNQLIVRGEHPDDRVWKVTAQERDELNAIDPAGLSAADVTVVVPTDGNHWQRLELQATARGCLGDLSVSLTLTADTHAVG